MYAIRSYYVENMNDAGGIVGITITGEHPSRMQDNLGTVLIQLTAEGLDFPGVV